MNREAYNRISRQWDAARRSLVGRERDYLEVLLQDLPEGSPILDVGCGTGRPMGEHVIARGYRVIGIDQSDELIEIASARFPNERWILAPIETHAFRESYRAAILWDSLFHIDRACHGPILRRVIAGLPDRGRLMLTVGGSEHPAFTDFMFGQEFFYDSNTPEETGRILRDLGCGILVGEFMNVPTGGRDKGRYAFVAQKL